MKSLRVWSWLISGFFRKQRKIIVLAFSLGIFMMLFVLWVLPYIPRPNPVDKIGLVGQYRRNNLPSFITAKVGQGLTTILEDGSPAPALAYEWAVSNDGTVYTFFIRDNLFWQDGTKVKVGDISYNFADVTTKVLDDLTLEFTLKTPLTPFPNLVNQPILKNNVFGTGEYKIRNIKEKSSFLETLTLESPQETIRIKFYPNLQTAMLAFKLGEIDSIQDIYTNPFDQDPIWKEHLEISSQRETSQHIALFLNNKDPLFGKDKNFRQALAYATQKPQNSTRALSPISVDSWAFNPNVKPYDYEPQRALELLEKSFGSLEKASETKLTISTTQAFLDVAEHIKRDWEEVLKLSVDITVINTLSDDFQILLASHEIPSDADQYSLWHSTQKDNIIHFKNFRIDKLLEDARREPDQARRTELYQDFQRFFVEESPVIFLSYPEVYTLKRKSVIKPVMEQLRKIQKQ